jgi:large conductance mechanosensitive channel
MGFISEFKEFAMRGNVVDMAVGIIIGAAFGKITTSVVNDIIMPPIGYLMGGADFADKVFVLREAGPHPVTQVEMEAVVIRYGALINVLLNFLIVAFAVFLLIKAMNSLKKKEEAAPEAPAAPPADVVLLGEIRDLLAKQK